MHDDECYDVVLDSRVGFEVGPPTRRRTNVSELLLCCVVCWQINLLHLQSYTLSSTYSSTDFQQYFSLAARIRVRAAACRESRCMPKVPLHSGVEVACMVHA